MIPKTHRPDALERQLTQRPLRGPDYLEIPPRTHMRTPPQLEHLEPTQEGRKILKQGIVDPSRVLAYEFEYTEATWMC